MSIPSRMERLILQHLKDFVESETIDETFYWRDFIASRRERIQTDLNITSVTPIIVRIFRMLQERGCLSQISTRTPGVLYRFHLDRFNQDILSFPSDSGRDRISDILARNNFRSIRHAFPWLDINYPGMIQEVTPRPFTLPRISRAPVSPVSPVSPQNSVPPPVVRPPIPVVRPPIPVVRPPIPVVRPPIPVVRPPPVRHPPVRPPIPRPPPVRSSLATRLLSPSIMTGRVPVHITRHATRHIPVIPVPGPPGRRGAFLQTSVDNPLYILGNSAQLPRGRQFIPSNIAPYVVHEATPAINPNLNPDRAGIPWTNRAHNTSGNSTDLRGYVETRRRALLDSFTQITSEESCTICRDKLIDRVLPCTHELCSSCIDRISSRDGLCPFCRVSFCPPGLNDVEFVHYVWNNE